MSSPDGPWVDISPADAPAGRPPSRGARVVEAALGWSTVAAIGNVGLISVWPEDTFPYYSEGMGRVLATLFSAFLTLPLLAACLGWLVIRADFREQ